MTRISTLRDIHACRASQHSHMAVLRDQSQKSHSVWRHTHFVCCLVYCPPPQQGTYIEIVIIILETITSPKPGDQGSHTHPFGILRFSNTCLYLQLPFFMWGVQCKWMLASVCKFGYWALPRSVNPLMEAGCSAHSFTLNSVKQRWLLSWVSGGKEVNLQAYYFVIFFLWIRWNYGLM